MNIRSIAIVGCGEIARKQHARFLRSDDNDTGFRIVATADPHARIHGLDVRHYQDYREMLAAEPEIAAVAVCTPTFTHFEIARDALLARKHTLLEKPPTSTIAELLELRRIAEESDVVLCTSFHAQQNAAVRKAAGLLSSDGSRTNLQVSIEWRENYNRWHPGQDWPWRRGGCGVFDSGINALSILSCILPNVVFRVLAAQFLVPANAETPCAATVQLSADAVGRGDFLFAWTKGGEDRWEIAVRTTNGASVEETITIENLSILLRNDEVVFASAGDDEYAGVYLEFAGAVESGVSKISLKEMEIIEKAFALAEVERLEISY